MKKTKIRSLKKCVMLLLTVITLVNSSKCQLRAEATVEDVPITGLTFDDPKDMYTYFISETSFINDNADYAEYLYVNTRPGMRKSLMKFNSYLTQDDVDNMTEYEAFIYMFTYQKYQSILESYASIDSIDIIETKLYTQESLLKSYPDGDKVYNAILTVMTYQWEYEQYTGEVLNIYDPLQPYFVNIYSEEITIPESETTGASDTATETQTTEAASAEDTTKQEIEDQDTPKDTLKKDFVATIIKYSLTLVILLITVIALVVIYFVKKKRNY